MRSGESEWFLSLPEDSAFEVRLRGLEGFRLENRKPSRQRTEETVSVKYCSLIWSSVWLEVELERYAEL